MTLARDPIYKRTKPRGQTLAPRLGFSNPIHPVDTKLLSEMRNPAGLPLFKDGGFLGNLNNKMSTNASGGMSTFGKMASNSGFGGVAGFATGAASSLINDKHTQTKGAVGGIGAGIAAGAALGPLGMIGGGLIGGVTGWLKGKREKEQIREETRQLEEQKVKLDNQAHMNYSRGVLNSYPTEGVEGASYFKYGGSIQDPPKSKYGKEEGRLAYTRAWAEGQKLPDEREFKNRIEETRYFNILNNMTRLHDRTTPVSQEIKDEAYKRAILNRLQKSDVQSKNIPNYSFGGMVPNPSRTMKKSRL